MTASSLNVDSAASPSEPACLLAVDRALAEFRRGRPLVIAGQDGCAALVLAAEAVTPEALERLSVLGGSEPLAALTARRAAVLNLALVSAPVVLLRPQARWDARFLSALADPTADLPATLPAFSIEAAPERSCAEAAVGLAKLARLLPAAVVAPLVGAKSRDVAAWAARENLLVVDAADIQDYQTTAARTLHPVSEARVPLEGAENTRIVAFRPVDGGIEHLALIIGEPDPDQPVLVRLHSECFTGDLLGSLRCDCGDQLRGAILEIARTGSGILLYLAQEGRGIGLVNKLRAYGLQDKGFDTIDANEQLGFDADERVYLPAAEMLKRLGIRRVRLMTNNPQKVDALARCGIDVAERVPHVFPANDHNALYLQTKAHRSGHLF